MSHSGAFKSKVKEQKLKKTIDALPISVLSSLLCIEMKVNAEIRFCACGDNKRLYQFYVCNRAETEVDDQRLIMYHLFLRDQNMFQFCKIHSRLIIK